MSDDPRHSTGSYAGWGLGGLILIYFGFPAIWMLLLYKIYPSRFPQWLDPLFIPLGWLEQQFPIYALWLQWNSDLLGMK